MIPTQASYLGVPGTALFALLVTASLLAFAYTVSRRWALLTSGGGPDPRWDRIPERIRTVVTMGLLQKRMFRDPYAGLYHILIFSGLFLITIGLDEVANPRLRGIQKAS